MPEAATRADASEEDRCITGIDGLDRICMITRREIFYLDKVEPNEFPIGFKLVVYSDSLAVLKNLTHDFPTRIEYRLLKKRANESYCKLQK